MNIPLEIYLIRHGETAWSLSGQHTGRTDLPLTPHGEGMARGLSVTLRGISFSTVLTSPRLRAHATCVLAGQGSAAQIDPDLAEWDYGLFEGLRTPEIRQQRANWNVWTDGCPGGESPADISARADHLINRLTALTGKVLLFSHGQLSRVLAARWVGLPVMQGQHFAIDPASVSILSFETGHPQRRVISLWNSTSQWHSSATDEAHST